MDWDFAAARPAVWAEQPVCCALRLHRPARRQHARLERHSQSDPYKSGASKITSAGESPKRSAPGSDAFFRNQGVGSWEINLAAFLADLNANVWLPTVPPDNNYYYYHYLGYYNQGIAFDDARALLAYRYSNDYMSLTTAAALLNGAPGFNQDNIDGYSDGPLMTTTAGINENIIANQDNTNLLWAGANNTNHFFTHQELFAPAKAEWGAALPGFIERLQQAGMNVSTYDRYTFYRLLSQLGTDSTPDSGKMNLNYDNLDPFVTNYAGNLVTNSPASTNFMAWTPLSFFTNAADRLLRAYTSEWRNSNPTNFAAAFYSVSDFTFTNQDQLDQLSRVWHHDTFRFW